eukprot:901180-Amphidinium_carterae.1
MLGRCMWQIPAARHVHLTTEIVGYHGTIAARLQARGTIPCDFGGGVPASESQSFGWGLTGML